MSKMNVHGREIAVSNLMQNEDYISITDIAKHKDEQNPRFIIKTGCETVTRLSFWEYGNCCTIQILTVSNSRRLEPGQV